MPRRGRPATEPVLVRAAQYDVMRSIAAATAGVLCGETAPAEGARLLMKRNPRSEFGD